jgi:hypothetical protein
MAEAATRYWKRRLGFERALGDVQRMGMLEGSYHPAVSSNDQSLVDNWRAALVRQLLTPAWDTSSVRWKQTALATGEHRHTEVKPERIERAISEDLAFLAAHPVRRSDSEAATRKREFNDAMRQRIRDVAASRDLSDEEIKPALSLKHEAVGEFVEKHGVNWPWLLEGNGRIFESDPIRLNPNMSGGELAAVVATMPEADQQVIRTLVRDVLQERDQ